MNQSYSTDRNRSNNNPPYPTEPLISPPYPTEEFSWIPNEELNRSSQSYIFQPKQQQQFYSSDTFSQNSIQTQSVSHVGSYPPPLPPKPPQDVLEHHFPQNNSSRNNSYSVPQRPELHSYPSSSQVTGPRDMPSRFLSNPLYPKQQFTQSQNPTTPNSKGTYDFRSNPPSSSSNRISRYDQMGPASSPVMSNFQLQSPLSSNYIDPNSQVPSSTPSTPIGISGPRPFPSSLNSSPVHVNSSPVYQYCSPEITPLKVDTSITSSFQNLGINNSAAAESPITFLPDIPVPISATDSSSTSNAFMYRKDSPSPTRNSLYGPRSRLEPSQSTYRQTSPSTSPTRNYYNNRNSWNSEYSLHEINTESDYNEIFDANETSTSLKSDEIPKPTIFDTIVIPETKLFSQVQQPYHQELQSQQSQNNSLQPPLPDIPRSSKHQHELPQISLDLPSLPFSSSSLRPELYNECEQIYFLSSIYNWSVKLELEWCDGSLITKDEYIKTLKQLLQHKNPKLKDFIIEKNVQQILDSFQNQNAIEIQNSYVRFFDNFKVSGVLTQLTGCYSRSHNSNSNTYQCYSSRCSLTIYQPPSHAIPSRDQLDSITGDWAQYWHISNEELDELDRKQVKKQSHIFELIRQQKNAIRLGDIQLYIYGKSFKKTVPQLLPDMGRFYNDAFNSVKPLITLHRTLLLEPLIERLSTQGKFINGVGDIFLNWASQATVPYLKYTRKMATVREFITREKSIDSRLANWLKEMDQHPDVVKASLDHNRIFFGGFIAHTQSLLITLKSVHKATAESDEDFKLLEKARIVIDELNKEIDQTQETSLQINKLDSLAKKLAWKSNLIKTDLKFSDPKRRIIKTGEVTRKSDYRLSSTNLLILLDNYLLITEPKEEYYKIIERPIPIEFLSLETKNFSNIKPKLVEGESYPFKIRYTGQDISFTFYADTLAERDSWFNAFTEVQQTKVQVSHTDSFKLTVLSDLFAYKEGQQPLKLPVCAPGSNIDVMLKSFQATLEQQQQRIKPAPIMHSEVLSAATVHFKNQTYYLIGLGFGLYLTEAGNPRGWVRVLELKKITQLEQLGTLIILIADKALYHFSIVSLLMNYYDINRDGHIVGERISRNNVSFIKIGDYGDTKFLFLVKQAIKSAEFKVFTPIFDRFGVFHHFELYKKFPMNVEVSGISLFDDLFVVHTNKGFGNMIIGSYDPQSIPRFADNSKNTKNRSSKTPFDIIKKKLKNADCKPLKMARVPNKKLYYLIYDTFAVVIDTMGELISEKFAFQFPFKCSNVSLKENFLICVGEDVIEIFDLSYSDTNGFNSLDPVQLITGKDIKLIDEDECKISMAHPTAEGIQLVFCFERIKL